MADHASRPQDDTSPPDLSALKTRPWKCQPLESPELKCQVPGTQGNLRSTGLCHNLGTGRGGRSRCGFLRPGVGSPQRLDTSAFFIISKTGTPLLVWQGFREDSLEFKRSKLGHAPHCQHLPPLLPEECVHSPVGVPKLGKGAATSHPPATFCPLSPVPETSSFRLPCVPRSQRPGACPCQVID